MGHKGGCLARPDSNIAKRVPRRVPIGDARGTSWNPQLLIVAASLALWTIIIGTGALVLN